MPKLNDPRPLKRYHIVLYEDDYAFLQVLFGQKNVSEGIRKIVAKSVKVLRDQSSRTAPSRIAVEELAHDDQPA